MCCLSEGWQSSDCLPVAPAASEMESPEVVCCCVEEWRQSELWLGCAGLRLSWRRRRGSGHRRRRRRRRMQWKFPNTVEKPNTTYSFSTTAKLFFFFILLYIIEIYTYTSIYIYTFSNSLSFLLPYLVFPPQCESPPRSPYLQQEAATREEGQNSFLKLDYSLKGKVHLIFYLAESIVFFLRHIFVPSVRSVFFWKCQN